MSNNSGGGDNAVPPQRGTLPNTAPRVLVKSRAAKDPNILDLDPQTLDPNKHYRWVRSRGDESHMSVTKHKLRGYQVEKKTEGGVKTLAEQEPRPDNVIAIGDLILMSCPKDVHERRQNEKRARREALISSTTAETEAMAKAKGVELIHDPDHGKIQAS